MNYSNNNNWRIFWSIWHHKKNTDVRKNDLKHDINRKKYKEIKGLTWPNTESLKVATNWSIDW